jgi:hypothetical protein
VTAPGRFESWAEVVAYAQTHEFVGYHAPLDGWPRRVRVVRVFKNGKVRLAPTSAGADRFTADEGHLARMRRSA